MDSNIIYIKLGGNHSWYVPEPILHNRHSVLSVPSCFIGSLGRCLSVESYDVVRRDWYSANNQSIHLLSMHLTSQRFECFAPTDCIRVGSILLVVFHRLHMLLNGLLWLDDSSYDFSGTTHRFSTKCAAIFATKQHLFKAYVNLKDAKNV